MAPSRRQSSGRSPLVNPQRQITSFFSKTTASPSPILSKRSPKTVPDSVPKNPKSNPNPSPSSSPGPTTPSPLQSKPKKPLMVIGGSPSTPVEKRSYGEDVSGRRIKIYWPLDKAWYEGYVKSFDKDANKHLVQYDDAEEELLDLEKEKIEWVDESVKKKLRRLRRGSSDSKDGEEVEIVKEEEGVEEFKRSRRQSGRVVVEDEEVESDGHDDSSDEDWGKNVEEDVVEDGEEDMDLEEENEGVKGSKAKPDRLKKRKVSEGERLGSAKKNKNGSGGGGTGGGVGKGGWKVSSVEPAGNGENK